MLICCHSFSVVIAVYMAIIHYGVFVDNSVYIWYNTYISTASDSNQDETRSTSHDAANAVCAGSGDPQVGRAHGGRPRDSQERWGRRLRSAQPQRSEPVAPGGGERSALGVRLCGGPLGPLLRPSGGRAGTARAGGGRAARRTRPGS